MIARFFQVWMSLVTQNPSRICSLLGSVPTVCPGLVEVEVENYRGNLLVDCELVIKLVCVSVP